MFWAEMWKYQNFLSENYHFLVVKFSVYWNRRVFVMEELKNVKKHFCFPCYLLKLGRHGPEMSWTNFFMGQVVLNPYWRHWLGAWWHIFTVFSCFSGFSLYWCLPLTTVNGKYQNKEKSLKHQKRRGLIFKCCCLYKNSKRIYKLS